MIFRLTTRRTGSVWRLASIVKKPRFVIYFVCNASCVLVEISSEIVKLIFQIFTWLSQQTDPCRASAREMDALKTRCAALLHFVFGRNLDLLHYVGRSTFI